MDIYTRMVDCPEIQGLWEPSMGDRCLWGTRAIFIDEKVLIRDMKSVQVWSRNVFTPENKKYLLLEIDDSWAYAAFPPDDQRREEAEETISLVRKFYKEHAKWLPRQEDWQNILFLEHYGPAVTTKKKFQVALIHMHREFVDYMETWKIDQPREAWARLYMLLVRNKQWTEKGWV